MGNKRFRRDLRILIAQAQRKQRLNKIKRLHGLAIAVSRGFRRARAVSTKYQPYILPLHAVHESVLPQSVN